MNASKEEKGACPFSFSTPRRKKTKVVIDGKFYAVVEVVE